MLRSPSPPLSPQGDFSETLRLPVLLVLRYPPSPPSPQGDFSETLSLPVLLVLRSPLPSPPSPQGDFSETLRLPVLLVLRYLSPSPSPQGDFSETCLLSYSCSVPPPLSPLPSGRFLRDAKPPCPTRAPFPLPSPPSPQGDFSETLSLPVLLVLRSPSPLPPPLREISQRR